MQRRALPSDGLLRCRRDPPIAVVARGDPHRRSAASIGPAKTTDADESVHAPITLAHGFQQFPRRIALRPSIGRILVEEQDEWGATRRITEIARNLETAHANPTSAYLINEVEILPTQNVMTQRRAYDLRELSDYDLFLHRPTPHSRGLRRDGICLTVAPGRGGGWQCRWSGCVRHAYRPPGPLFRLPPRQWWTRRMSLRTANHFGPRMTDHLPLVGLSFPFFAFLYDNFELFVQCAVTPMLLLRLTGVFAKYLRKGAFVCCEPDAAPKNCFSILRWSVTRRKAHAPSQTSCETSPSTK